MPDDAENLIRTSEDALQVLREYAAGAREHVVAYHHDHQEQGHYLRDAQAFEYAARAIQERDALALGSNRTAPESEEAVAAVPRGVKVRRPMTSAQQRLYELIVGYTCAHGYPPTLRELREAVGTASTNAVADHLKALRKKGWINWTPGLARTLKAVGDPPY